MLFSVAAIIVISTEEIADAAGFSTADAMRRTFSRILGITPAEYIHRFKRLTQS